MLELYDLEKLVMFKSEGTLVAASEKLLISQPALSRSMRKIEDEIGVELFTRSKNRMELNENGLSSPPNSRRSCWRMRSRSSRACVSSTAHGTQLRWAPSRRSRCGSWYLPSAVRTRE